MSLTSTRPAAETHLVSTIFWKAGELMVHRRLIRTLLAGLIGLVLAGCTSRDPLDYLPRGMVYAGLNVERAKAEAGMKRFLDLLNKLSVSGSTNSDAVRNAYFVVGDPRAGGGLAACVVGTNGLAGDVFNRAKSEGATPQKLNGFDALRLPQAAYIIRLSPGAVLIADSEKTFGKMLETAKKKSPSAATDSAFSKLQSLNSNHPFAVVANVAEFAGQASQAMAASPLGKGAAQASEAIRNITLLSLTAEWPEQPKVELIAYTQKEEDAKALAGLIQLVMMTQGSQLPPLLKNIRPASTPEGLVLSMEIPKEEADKFLAKLEEAGKDLPSDPAARKTEIEKRIQSLMTAF